MLKPNNAVTTNLIRARELIADEKNWCKERMYSGNRMCALGAIRKVEGLDEFSWDAPSTYYILAKAAEEFTESRIFGIAEPALVNDLKGHAVTIKMFDRAIELSLQDAS